MSESVILCITYLSKEGVVSCKHGTQDVCTVNNVNHPAIRAGSLPVSQEANLPGYYKIANETQDPLLIAHNFSNILSTMRT